MFTAIRTQRRTIGPWAVLPHFRRRLFLRCEMGHFMIPLLPRGHVNDNGLTVLLNWTETQLLAK